MKKLLLAVCLILPVSANAITLGTFNFNDSQFGDTVTASDGGTDANTNWLNVVNSNPGLVGSLTGANFDTGIANIGAPSVSYTIGYNAGIQNGVGDDIGIVVARYSSDPFDIAFSTDGVTFGPTVTIGAASAVATGENRTYFYNGGGPFSSQLFVHALDLGNFGIADGASIAAVRITGSTELDLIRAGGLTAVPEPSTYILFGMGLAGLMLIGRRRKSV